MSWPTPNADDRQWPWRLDFHTPYPMICDAPDFLRVMADDVDWRYGWGPAVIR